MIYNSFEAFMVQLAPGWLRAQYTARRNLEAKGMALDDLLALYAEAVRVRHIPLASADAIALLSEERMLEAYPSETLENWRQRVQGAWEFWKWAGTNTGILIALDQMGYKARITELYHFYPNRPHDFTLDLIYPGNLPEPTRYDELDAVYDDPNSLYDLRVTSSEITRIRRIVDKVKAAHSRLVAITLGNDDGTYYDDPSAVYDTENTEYDDGYAETLDFY